MNGSQAQQQHGEATSVVPNVAGVVQPESFTSSINKHASNETADQSEGRQTLTSLQMIAHFATSQGETDYDIYADLPKPTPNSVSYRPKLNFDSL